MTRPVTILATNPVTCSDTIRHPQAPVSPRDTRIRCLRHLPTRKSGKNRSGVTIAVSAVADRGSLPALQKRSAEDTEAHHEHHQPVPDLCCSRSGVGAAQPLPQSLERPTALVHLVSALPYPFRGGLEARYRRFELFVW